MSSENRGMAVDHHDWHSPRYVEEWITRDLSRDEERRLRLRQMLAAAPFAAEAEITVLDVGGGYGVVTEEVLRAFPRAIVTLQDYSAPMLDQARQRLVAHTARVKYSLADLRDRAWTTAVGGLFDLAVSAIAIHNLRDLGEIAASYRGIAAVLKPGGMFLIRSVRINRRNRCANPDDPRCRLCDSRLPLETGAACDHPRRPTKRRPVNTRFS